LSDVETEEFLGEIERFASTVIPANRLAVVRDPADNHLLDAAAEGQADYIVSGDRDLLDLGSYEGVEIVTPARFLAVLREASSR
jgi:putative PIN family toxin of toxin-antitoxin system